jgi:hypothetical protein
MTTHARGEQDGYRGLAHVAMATGAMQVARDILTDPQHARKRARALELGYASSIAFPLKSEEQIVGVCASCR